jgi:hypothetical protein
MLVANAPCWFCRDTVHLEIFEGNDQTTILADGISFQHANFKAFMKYKYNQNDAFTSMNVLLW